MYSSCIVQDIAKYNLCIVYVQSIHIQFMYIAFVTKIILKKNNKPLHLVNSNGYGLVQ